MNGFAFVLTIILLLVAFVPPMLRTLPNHGQARFVRLKHNQTKNDKTENSGNSNTFDVDAWVETDDPVRSAKDDRFNHRPEAESLARAMVESKGTQSILIQGGFGSGKTSLINLAMSEIKSLPTTDGDDFSGILLVPVSLWARADINPTRVMLDAALAELSRYADVGSLVSVPDAYRKILEAAPVAGFKLLAASMTDAKNPDEVLYQINALLRSIGIRLYVVIEDLDRTMPFSKPIQTWSDGQRRSLFEVQRLLEDLRKQGHLGVILTINSEALSQLDEVTLRVIDRKFSIARLDTVDVLNRVVIPWCQKRVDEAKDAGLILPWLKRYSTTNIRTNEKPDEWFWLKPCEPELQFFSMLSLDTYQNRDIFALLMNRPRILRATLKTAKAIWDGVMGEVNLEDVILYAALETVEGGKFGGFVRDYWDPPIPRDRDGNTSANDLQSNTGRVYSIEQLDKLLEGIQRPTDGRLITRLVDWFIPNQNEAETGHPSQSTRTDRRYRRRLINRRVSDQDGGYVLSGLSQYSGETPRDQRVLKLWREWLDGKSSDTSSNETPHHSFVKQMDDNRHFTDAFETLVTSDIIPELAFNDEHFVRLFDEVTAYGLDTRGGNYNNNVSAAYWFFYRRADKMVKNNVDVMQHQCRRWLSKVVNQTMSQSIDFATSLDQPYSKIAFSYGNDVQQKYRDLRITWIQAFFEWFEFDMPGLRAALPDVPDSWDQKDRSSSSLGWQLFWLVEQFEGSERGNLSSVPFSEGDWDRLVPMLTSCIEDAVEKDDQQLRKICVQVIRLFTHISTNHRWEGIRHQYDLQALENTNATESHRQRLLGVWRRNVPEWLVDNDLITHEMMTKVDIYLATQQGTSSQKTEEAK